MKLPLVETSYKNVVPNQNYTEIVFLAIKVYLYFAPELLNSIRVINFRMNVEYYVIGPPICGFMKQKQSTKHFASINNQVHTHLVRLQAVLLRF